MNIFKHRSLRCSLQTTSESKEDLLKTTSGSEEDSLTTTFHGNQFVTDTYYEMTVKDLRYILVNSDKYFVNAVALLTNGGNNTRETTELEDWIGVYDCGDSCYELENNMQVTVNLFDNSSNNFFNVESFKFINGSLQILIPDVNKFQNDRKIILNESTKIKVLITDYGVVHLNVIPKLTILS